VPRALACWFARFPDFAMAVKVVRAAPHTFPPRCAGVTGHAFTGQRARRTRQPGI